MPLTHTLTAASTSLPLTTATTCQPVPFKHGHEAPTSSFVLGDQVATIDVVSTSAIETGKLVMVLYDPSTTTKLRCIEFTLSVSSNAYQANAAGNGGGYVCVVTSAVDGTNKLDLLGMDDRTRTISSAGAMASINIQELQWYVCAASMIGTSWTVNITPTRCT